MAMEYFETMIEGRRVPGSPSHAPVDGRLITFKLIGQAWDATFIFGPPSAKTTDPLVASMTARFMEGPHAEDVDLMTVELRTVMAGEPL
jgi:hypothetical protein